MAAFGAVAGMVVLGFLGCMAAGEAIAVVAPGELGSFGVLAHHQPMIATLAAGAGSHMHVR